MAEEKDGRWVARDGSFHYTEGYARKHEQDLDRGAGNDGGGLAGQGGGWLMWILFLGPIIVGKVIGWLFGILSHLGIVGKILQTAVMFIVGLFYGLFLISSMQMWCPFSVKILEAPVMMSFALLAPLWFWVYHSDAVKLMGANEFSRLLKNAVSFIWFGSIGGAIIGWIAGGDGDTMFYVFLSITLVAGLVYYLIKAKPYTQEAEALTEQSTRNTQKKIWRIGLIVVGAVFAVLTVIYSISAAATLASEKKFENMVEEIRENPAGQTVVILSASLSDYKDVVSIYAAASPTSAIVSTIPYNKYTETGTLTGAVSGLWAEVDYKGTKGWVYTPFLTLTVKYGEKDISKKYFDSYPFEATVSATINPVINSRPVTIEKGTKVTVTRAGSIEYNNKTYYLKNNDFELVVPVK